MRFAWHTAPDARAAANARARDAMVATQIEDRGIRDPGVLAAMRAVPRHLFVDDATGAAYEDRPLAIGGGQTISQPYIVARMTEALALGPGDRVLEIGTGCGYQTAVLAALVSRVFTIEYDAELLEGARATLARLGIDNVVTRHGDGAYGWPEEAPFDAILIAAATPAVPAALCEQLRDGGSIVLPLGEGDVQELVRIARHGATWERHDLGAVRFVPMRGLVREECE